jgi:hypothetical protein
LQTGLRENTLAAVPLTWAAEREKPPWPGTSLFDSFGEWERSVREVYDQAR